MFARSCTDDLAGAARQEQPAAVFRKKAEIRRHKPPVRAKAHHAAVIMAGKRQIGSI